MRRFCSANIGARLDILHITIPKYRCYNSEPEYHWAHALTGEFLEPVSSLHSTLMATNSHESSQTEEESCLGEHAKSTLKRRNRRILPSWKLGVSGWTSLAALVLFLNIGLSSYVNTHFGYSGGLGSLMTGKCNDVRKAGVVAHLFINVLSTLLLSGCNYCMQCLSAPSRREVDQAHRSARALDIGIPTIRNFYSIDRRRTVVWCLLGLSSLPLHLL